MKGWGLNINSERANCSLHFLKNVLLLLVLLIPQFLFTQQLGSNTIILKIDNFKRALKVAAFNGKEYFALSNFTPLQIKHKSNQTEPFAVKCGNYQFSFLPGSIYFILRNLRQGNEQILQISSPAIYLNGELWIPLKAFTNCLTSIPLFEHSVAGNSIALNTKKEKPTKSSLETNKRTTTSQPNRVKENKTQQAFDTREQPAKIISPLPKINLTLNERLALEPQPSTTSNKNNSYKGKSEKIKETPKQKSRTADTTLNIPPKYYVLPPALKNNPK
jgi:hypothetical protein